jgi:hypothetical protein
VRYLTVTITLNSSLLESGEGLTVDSARHFRQMAEELRVVAAEAQDERTKRSLLTAAENYDRVADSWSAIENSRIAVRRTASSADARVGSALANPADLPRFARNSCPAALTQS